MRRKPYQHDKYLSSSPGLFELRQHREQFHFRKFASNRRSCGKPCIYRCAAPSPVWIKRILRSGPRCKPQVHPSASACRRVAQQKGQWWKRPACRGLPQCKLCQFQHCLRGNAEHIAICVPNGGTARGKSRRSVRGPHDRMARPSAPRQRLGPDGLVDAGIGREPMGFVQTAAV